MNDADGSKGGALERADSITFFVPCLNEQGNIGGVIANVKNLADELKVPYEILVVDDASTDGTLAEVDGARQAHPSVSLRVIKNSERQGLGRNYFSAAREATGTYYMMVCGDAAEPPETLRAIVSLRGQADAIVPYFGSTESRSSSRKGISMIFARMISLLSGHSLKYYNGPVLHRTANVQRFTMDVSGFGYQAELLCRLLDSGGTAKEVQVVNRDRQHGVSKALSVKNLLSLAGSLLRIAARRVHLLRS